MPLVLLYPGVKRVSYWPQLILGLTFNWGALLGYAAIHGNINFPIVLSFYLAGVAWTLHYDTIYAFQDIKDDLQVNIKSLAIRTKDNYLPWLAFFNSITISGILLSGFNAGVSWVFYPIMGLALSHLCWQMTLNIEDEADCGRKFRSNKIFGFIVFVALVFGVYF